MTPPHFPHARQDDLLRRSLAEIGVLIASAEPEVVRADLARIQAKSLARIIANLINANEPLLKAETDGAVVAVDERGGTGGFVVTVTPALAARSLDGELDPR